MIYQYYFKRLKLFKIPYRILLAYHCPAGNSVKKWTYYQMLPHIIAIRKEIHILSMTFTVIQIRKALNTLFKRINTRGSFLIYASSNGIRMNNNSIFVFVSVWLPGLLTNYRQLVISIRRYQKYNNILSFYLKRPQEKAVMNVDIKSTPMGHKLTRNIKRRVPSLPSISLSLSDNKIWLNETACLDIPSIQLCDTQSHIQKISYPIVSNQQSITFSFLILSLFSETCNYSLIYEHLYFLSIYKFLNVKKRFKKHLNKKKILFNILHKNTDINLNTKSFYDENETGYKFWLDKYSKLKKSPKFRNKLAQNIRINQFRYRNKIKTILNKKTYIFNYRLFSYQFRDLISYDSKVKSDIVSYNYTFLDFLRTYFFNFLAYSSLKLKLFEKFHKIRNYKKRIHLLKLFNLKKSLYIFRRKIHSLYVKFFGLDVILSIKRRQKARFINKITLRKQDLPNRFLLGFLYAPHIFLLLQKFSKKPKKPKVSLLKKNNTKSKSLPKFKKTDIHSKNIKPKPKKISLQIFHKSNFFKNLNKYFFLKHKKKRKILLKKIKLILVKHNNKKLILLKKIKNPNKIPDPQKVKKIKNPNKITNTKNKINR